MQSMIDAAETSVSLKLFNTKQAASYALLFKSAPVAFPIAEAREMENFNAEVRLSDSPYPPEDRPRGRDDMLSLQYTRRAVRNGEPVEPIWIAKRRGGTYILLDGAHRIAAFHLEKKRSIPAFIVSL